MTTANRCIGIAEDRENDVIYYIYDNSFIFRFNPPGNNVTLLFKDGVGGNSYFSLDIQYPIYNARYFDGKIYLTDNNSQPKVIDLERGENYINNFEGRTYRGVWDSTTSYVVDDVIRLKGYYWVCVQSSTGNIPPNATYWTQLSLVSESYRYPLTEVDLLFIATPPLYPPSYQWASDASQVNNFLLGKHFDFCYRWVYYDYRKSVFSPISLMVMSNNPEDGFNLVRSSFTFNNVIQITCNTGPGGVRGVEIAVRSSDDLSQWYYVEVLEKVDSSGRILLPDNVDVIVNFLNNKPKEAVATTDIVKPYHYVPPRAKFLEIIENNHMVFAGCNEGLDSDIDIDVTYQKSFQDIRNKEAPTASRSRQYLSANLEKKVEYLADDLVRTTSIWYIRLPPQNALRSATVTRLYVVEVTGAVSLSAFIDYAAETYPNDTRTRLYNACLAAGMNLSPCWEAAWNADRICFNEVITYGTVEESYEDYSISSYFDWAAYYAVGHLPYYPMYRLKKLNLKAGKTHPYGLVYFDGQRRAGSVVGVDQMRPYLEYYGEDNDVGIFRHYYVWKLSFYINHIPPPWAKAYAVVYGSDGTTQYLYTFVSYGLSSLTDYIEIPIYIEASGWFNSGLDFKQGFYSFEEGDRIRYIGEVDLALSENIITPTEYIDLRVIGVIEDVDLSGDPYVISIKVEHFEGDSFLIGSGIFAFEIYRPNKTISDTLYYETGHVYEVKSNNGHLYHAGDIDQTVDVNGLSISPATIAMENGDSFKYSRPTRFSFSYRNDEFNVESSISSDWNEGTNYVGQGFPKIIDNDLKEKDIDNRLRYGGQLQLGTKNNQIADFIYADFKDMSEVFGIINGLELVGFVLKVLQSHKVWSIYVNRTSSFNPDGTETILLTDSVLGTVRPDSQEWGLQDPGAVSVHERYMYIWDRSKGLILRDSANGLFDISSYKMVKYFRDLSRNASASHKCKIGFNESFDEVYFAFFSAGGNNKIVVFNENENRKRWTHEIIVDTDNISNVGNYFMTHYQNVIYSWPTYAVNHGRIQGTTPSPRLEFVVNVDPEKVKRWRSMIMHSSHKFFAPVVGDISVPANDNYSDGMETRLLENKIDTKEGRYLAPIMNDANTPSASMTESEKIVSGRPMRGEVLLVDLSLDASGYSNQFINFEGLRVLFSDSENS
jgi:hypothetical protein